MRGTTPVESLRQTVRRLQDKIGPDGYHAGIIEERKRELREAEEDRDSDVATLREWETILKVWDEHAVVLEKAKADFAQHIVDFADPGARVVMQGNSDSPTT